MATADAAGAVGAMQRAAFEIQKRPYVRAFAALALKTFVEIQIPGLSIAKTLQVIFLIVFTVTKASIVVAYYMHLRYEPWVLAYIPLVPLILIAGLVLTITLV